MSNKDDNLLEPTIFENAVRNSNENKNKAYENSRKARDLKLSNKKKGTIKKRILITAIAGMVAGGMGTQVVYSNFAERKQQKELDDLFEDKYGSVIDDIVQRCSNPKNGSVDYIEIANEFRQLAKNDEELDNIIYEFYNSYGREVGVPMYNEIVSRTVSNIPKNNFDPDENYEFYEDLEDYVKTKGFDSVEEYDKVMGDKVYSEFKYDDVTQEKRGSK